MAGEWQYKVVKVRNVTGVIEKAINKMVAQGWELEAQHQPSVWSFGSKKRELTFRRLRS